MVSLEPVLVALVSRLKSPKHSVFLTTSDLGGMLGVSQQTASRYLIGLEEKGWVERRRAGRGFEVKLTQEGVVVLKGIFANLGRFLDSKSGETFEGVIVSGIGEGAYYVKEYARRIREALGYKPFFGTLNVKFEGGRPDLSPYKVDTIPPFKAGDRSFGGIDLVPVRLKVRGKAFGCHAIIPERTHHKLDLELISKDNLRREHGIRDGDRAVVSVSEFSSP